MSDNQDAGDDTILYLNYSVSVKSESEHELLSSVGGLEDKKSVKQKIRYKIGNKISRKLDSVGGSYLLPFDSEPDKNYIGGIFVGQGRQSDEHPLTIPIGVRTIIHPNSSSSKKSIWNSLKEKGTGIKLRVDRNLQGTEKSAQKGEYELIFSESKRQENIISESGENLPSYIPDDEHQKHKIEDEITNRSLGDPVGLTEEQIVGEEEIDHSELPNSADKILSNIEQRSVDNVDESYNENSTKVRKPTEEEFEKIIDNILDRLDEISDISDPTYLETIPDSWSLGTCSRCNEHTKQINIDLHSKTRRILTQQLKEGFGISPEFQQKSRREYIHSDTTNLMIDESGQVYYQPEEILSWIVDISHYVEPMCNECHTEFGGKGHDNIISVSTDDGGNPQEKLTSEYNMEQEDDGQREISDDIEPIKIETTDEAKRENHVGYYRPPTESELEYILGCISDYIRNLVTRERDGPEGGYKQRRSEIYRIVHKRKNGHKGVRSKICRCEVCKTRIGESDYGYKDLQKHHADPKRLQRYKVRMMRQNRTIDKASILVNDQNNDYILSDRFFWRLETLLKNIDTYTMFCKDCKGQLSENHVKPEEVEEHEQLSIHDETFEKDDRSQKDEQEQYEDVEAQILTQIRPHPLKKELEFQCYKCLNIYTARHQQQGYYTVVSDQERNVCNTPIANQGELNTQFLGEEEEYVGVCGRHKPGLMRDIKSQIEDQQSADRAEIVRIFEQLISQESI